MQTTKFQKKIEKNSFRSWSSSEHCFWKKSIPSYFFDSMPGNRNCNKPLAVMLVVLKNENRLFKAFLDHNFTAVQVQNCLLELIFKFLRRKDVIKKL